MSKKLSQKMLREIVAANADIDFDGIVEILDKNQASYNEHMLRGHIEDATAKGWLVKDGNTFAIKKRTSGGGAPTTLYRVDKPLTPEKAKIVSKPYSKELEEDDSADWARTELAAVRKAKARFYREVYWPGLEIYRELEEEHSAEEAAAA